MFKKYFNKVLLYNVLIAIGMLVLLLVIVQFGLKAYTHKGESITVPNLKGMTFEQVKNTLSSRNLNWEIMDSVYDMHKPALSIVDQNPKPDSKVKEGRTVYITINATKAPTTEIPDLVGRSSLKYAKMQLESYGLKVGELIYRPDPHLNSVIGMEINGKGIGAKARVPRGTIIDLVLGDGLGSVKIPVPYLIGLRYDEAEFKLRGYSLNMGMKIVDAGVVDTSSAIIYKQNPEHGEGRTIRMGEPIDLWLAKELPAGIVVDPRQYEDEDTTVTQ